MPHRSKVAIAARSMAAALSGLLVLAGPAGAEPLHSSEIGPRTQAKVQLRLSVRPTVRVAIAPSPGARFNGASPLCLWSNFDPGHYALRGEWSDGRSTELAAPAETPAGSCGNAGTMLHSSDLTQNSPAGPDRLVLLMIEGR